MQGSDGRGQRLFVADMADRFLQGFHLPLCPQKPLCCFTKSLITIPDWVKEECAARQTSHRMCVGLFCIAPLQGNVTSAPTNSEPTLSGRSLHVTDALWRSGLLSVLRSTHSSSWSSLEHGAVASSCSGSLKA